MRAFIEEAFAEADAETWEARLSEAGAPASRINTLADAVSHPQLGHRDVIQTVDGPYGEMTLIGSGFKLAHGGGEITRAPAILNEHAGQILAEAGYDEAEIGAMTEEGVV